MNLKKIYKKFAFLDKFFLVMVFLLFSLLRPDYILIFVFVFLFPYLFMSKRKNALNHLYLSSLISLTWVIIARNEYGYNTKMLNIFGLNTFPLFGWATGLFGLYLIYSYYEEKLKLDKNWQKFLLFIGMYWPLLIIAETLGYHVFNIHNVATGVYSGLPICDCLHAPTWMKISYFSLGPIYFGLCELLGLENPHKKQKAKK